MHELLRSLAENYDCKLGLQMMKYLYRLIIGVAAILTAATTAQAQDATGHYFDVLADAGGDDAVYAPISLGESFTLNACGSVVHAAAAHTPTVSWCDLPNLTEFNLTWTATSEAGKQVTIGSFSGETAVRNALTLSITTGLASNLPFATAGLYKIGLLISVNSSDSHPSFTHPVSFGKDANGQDIIRYPGNDFELSDDGSTNQSYAVASLTINAGSTSVPEPSSFFLLALILGFITWRERRKHARI